MYQEEVTLRCSNGFTLHAKDGTVNIESKRNTESIPVANIQSVTVKDPRALSPGTITFSTAQAATAGIHLGSMLNVAIGAEKTFFFSKADMFDAWNLKDYILEYDKVQQALADKAAQEAKKRAENVQRPTAPQQPAPAAKPEASLSDRLHELKALVDEGILTQEEYEKKKKMILGI